MVPEKDRPLQERQRSELPRQVMGMIKHSVTHLLIYFLHSSPRRGIFSSLIATSTCICSIFAMLEVRFSSSVQPLRWN